MIFAPPYLLPLSSRIRCLQHRGRLLGQQRRRWEVLLLLVRLPFLLCPERARGTTGRLAPVPWTGHFLSPAISNKNKTIKLLEIEWIRAQISL